MTLEFTRWPAELALRYREKGYWTDVPLSDIITRQKHNPNVAVIEGDRQITYQELEILSSRLAKKLYWRGLRNGDRAVVHLGNTLDLYIIYFALLKLGVVLVNALFSHRQLEIDSYVTQIQPKLFIGDRQNPLFKDDVYLTHLKTISPHLQTAIFKNGDLEELLKEDENVDETLKEAVLIPTPADEVAFLNLSGGSTGTPKLIPRTHNDYYYSVRRSVEVCQFNESTRYLIAIPAPHNFPMSSPGALGVFCSGGQVILSPDPSSASCFPIIQRHKVNVAALVPPAASLWLQEVLGSSKAESPLASLQLLQVGGARLSPTLAARLVDHLGVKLQQVFGMAEGLVCYTRLDDDLQLILTTQGLPMSDADDVWAADEDGNPVGPDEVGVLMTQGPYTFRGYYNAPEHNAKSFDAKGYYCSGDLIAIAKDGRITIHGRQKDQINRGGEKISTEEIENLLLRHPSVVEAGLVAMDDDLMGEKSVAFIMTSGAVKTAQLRKFLREQGVAEYKLPDKFSVVGEMPLTAVGKVDKKQLRILLKSQE